MPWCSPTRIAVACPAAARRSRARERLDPGLPRRRCGGGRGLAGASRRAVPRSARARRRRGDLPGMGARTSGLVPARVRLGGRLHLRRDAHRGGARSQPDWCQHVRSGRRSRARRSVRSPTRPGRRDGGARRKRRGDASSASGPRAPTRGATGCTSRTRASRTGCPRERATWRYFVRRCGVEGVAKGRLARIAGSGESLSSERRYVRSVLPRAVLRELAGAVRGRPGALARAGAIVAGVAITAAAYARTRLSAAPISG